MSESTVLELETLDDAVADALRAFEAAPDLVALAAVRPAHLGDRAPVLLARRELGSLPGSQRAEAVQTRQRRAHPGAGGVRRPPRRPGGRARRAGAGRGGRRRHPAVRPHPARARHPVTQIGERIADVFVAMGWEVAEGPEVESSWLNFDALNFKKDHPARTMQDTFYLGDGEDSGMVLRTHTSPVQIRALLERPLPVYVVCHRPRLPPRRARRHPAPPMFHQVEGLASRPQASRWSTSRAPCAFARTFFGETSRRSAFARVLPVHRTVGRVDVRLPEKSAATNGSRWAAAAWSTPTSARCRLRPEI